MPLLARDPVEAIRPRASDSEEILRFRDAERHLHWAIAIPFKVCYLTAVVLVLVYNPHPNRPFREIVSWVHRISGVCLALLPALTIVRHWRDFRIHLYNVRQGWTWNLGDLKWLVLMGPASVNKKIELPHQGKFNAGEKINFMVVMTTYPMYVATGLLIWFSAAPFLPWMVHFAIALLATPLVLGHILMATVNPDTRVGLTGMISGFVDRQWARHHYRLWYDEHYGHTPRLAPPVGREQPARQPAAVRYPAPVVENRVVPRLWPREPVSLAGSPATATRAASGDDPPGIAAPRDAESIVVELEEGSVARKEAGGNAGAVMAS